MIRAITIIFLDWETNEGLHTSFAELVNIKVMHANFLQYFFKHGFELSQIMGSFTK